MEEGTIVWEWQAWDHLVQDRDPELPGFGAIAEHPERIDIDHHPMSDEDWIHVNSIDYNAELDRIMLTVPDWDEVWIIDHSTTSKEAASSSGGHSGRGGDLLYRWGNPRAYDRGAPEDRVLFFSHHARWLGPGLSEDDPDQGNIIVFNNRLGGNSSAVDLFMPPMDDTGYVIDGLSPYGPTAAYRRITAPDPQSMYSSGLSSAQKMPNGNVVICSGRQGWIFEMDPDDNLVWEYLIPLISGVPVSQGTEIDGPGLFMAYKYPSDHPFLSIQTFPEGQYIELDPDTIFCGSINVAVIEAEGSAAPLMYPNICIPIQLRNRWSSPHAQAKR